MSYKTICSLAGAVMLSLVSILQPAKPAFAGCLANCARQHRQCLKRCTSRLSGQSPRCLTVCDGQYEKCKERCSPNPESTSRFNQTGNDCASSGDLLQSRVYEAARWESGNRWGCRCFLYWEHGQGRHKHHFLDFKRRKVEYREE